MLLKSRRLALAFFWLPAWAACAHAVSAKDASGTAADGSTFQGEFAGLAGPHVLRFTQQGSSSEVNDADLVAWGEFAEPVRGVQVVLGGSGVILAESPRVDKEDLRFESRSFGAVRLPLSTVAGLVLHPPLEAARHDQLVARIAGAAGQSDRVLLDNGDELTGTVTSLDEKTLALESDGGNVEIEISKVLAVIFNPSLRIQAPSGGLRMLVGFRDGSRVTAVKLFEEKEKGRVAIDLAGGGKLAVDAASIAALQTLGGKAEYLSDLKPASYKHIPFLTLQWPYANDRSVTGEQLRAGGKLYLKGIGMHSPARITYNLARPYRQFQAEVAVDDEAGARGSVVFRVFTDDGSGSWKQRAASEVMRGGDSPRPISVDLAGAKRVSLLVDYADRGDEMDHADWLNARLVR